MGNGREQAEQPKLLRGLWRQEVMVRLLELENRLAEALARGAVAESAEARAQADAVARALQDARLATVPERWSFSRIQHWWTGAAITRAWESLHLAEAGLVAISSPEARAEAVPRLRSWLQIVLPKEDPDLARYELEFDGWARARGADELALRYAYQAAIAANIEWHASLRAFRNVLFYVSGGLLLLLLALAAWHAIDTSVLPLSPAPQGRTPPASPPLRVLLVELLGAFGGLLSSAFLLGKLEKPPTRYNVLAPQIVLKAVAGAASGLVGLLLLGSGLILSAPKESSALLTYAVVFGFSQQLITQMIDRQSTTLLSPGGARSGQATGTPTTGRR